MMEYILMSFFMLLVILVLIFFIGWWEFSKLNAQRATMDIESSDELMNRLINSPILVRENSVFDDSRLMAVYSLESQGICQDLERLYGGNWFMEIQLLRPGSEDVIPCTASENPDCNNWVICPMPGDLPEDTEITRRALPVNVYRKSFDRTDMAVLYAGVYR